MAQKRERSTTPEPGGRSIDRITHELALAPSLALSGALALSGPLALALCLSLSGCGSADSTTSADGHSDANSGSGGTTNGTTADGTSDTSGGTSSATTTGATTTGTTTGGGGSANNTIGGSDSVSSTTGGNGSATSTTGTSGDPGPACPGVEPRADVPGETCRSAEDCDNGASCVPEPYAACGACVHAPRECEDDDQCGEGEHCVEFESGLSCLCSRELASECRPLCTETSCDEGYECVDGSCRPRSCTDGFQCASGTVCDVTTGECRIVHCNEEGAEPCPMNTKCDPTAPARGCSTMECDVDADCDCGACIQNCTGQDCTGRCVRRLYICEHPVP